MVRVPSCEKLVLKKGPWTPEEDQKLISYIQNHGHSSWRALPKQAGLSRCGKSCRLRWTNYLRPGIKRGNFSSQEENSIIQLHAVLGNRWSTIATHLPGRTDNEIKNHWNTRLRKRLLKMGIDPATHRPWPQQQPLNALQQAPNSINPFLLSLLQGHPSAAHTSPSLLTSLLLGSNYALTTNGLFPAASTSLPTPPPSSYPVSAVDPALLAAAETRLVLDCLKSSTAAQNHSSSSDDHINQLLTRLLLVKLLQSSNNHAGGSSIPAPCNDSKAMIHSIIAQQADQRSSPLQAADHHLIYKQGLQHTALASSMLPAGMNRLINESTAAPASSSAYVHSNTHNSMPASVLFPSSSYQQRLLQTFPFLVESVIEPSTSAATEHLSSNDLSQQANFITDSLAPTNGSLTSHQAPLFGCYNQVMPSGEQLLAAAGMSQANHQHHHNAMANSSIPTLMTWEELHMTQQHKGDDGDPASSSTANTTGSSTRSSSASADPNTPTNNINIQEYWSNLLNLISSTNNNHPLSTASD